MSYMPSPNLQPHQLNNRLPTNNTRSWLMTLVWLGLAAVMPLALRSQCAIAQPASTTASPSSVTQGVETATVLIVNPATGNDAAADGSEKAPFKTITQALQVAQPNTVIQLMPGTYSVETGESFPLKLRSGIIIQGNSLTRGSDIVIRGSGFFLSPTWARQNVAILGANQAALIGVTVTNPEPQGYGVWVESSSPLLADNTFTGSGHDGVSVTGNSAPLIRNNFFYSNGANGITIYNTSRPEVRENIFEQTGFGININQRAMPLIVGNRITLNKDGIVIQAKARPVLRNNSIEGNTRDGVVAIAESRPDLGSATEPGGNFIRNNGQFDVNAKATTQRILAFGNELTTTTGQIDLAGSDPETVPVAGTLDALPSGSSVASTPVPQPSASTLPTVPVAASSTIGAAPLPTVPIRPSAPVSPPTAPVAASAVTATTPLSPRSVVEFTKPLRPNSPPVSASQAVVTTIPFGERLSTVPVAQPVAARLSAGGGGSSPAQPQPVASQMSSASATSANAAPVSGTANGATPLPPVAIAAASSVPFPVPSALSGRGVSPPVPRPIQIVPLTEGEGITSGPSPFPGTNNNNAVPRSRSLPVPAAGGSEFPPPAALTGSVPVRTTVASKLSPLTPGRYQPLAPVSRSVNIAVPTPDRSSLPRSAAPTVIPVPPPERSLAVAPLPISRQNPLTPSMSVQATAPKAGIDIPVPLPEASAIAPPVVARPVQAPVAMNRPAQATNSNLLPVPDSNIPLGNAGSGSGVRVYGRDVSQDGTSPPAPPLRSASLGVVRYRVIVETSDSSEQAQVKALIPGAFLISSQGKSVMQVGAFGDRVRADDLVQTLSSQGLKATIEAID